MALFDLSDVQTSLSDLAKPVDMTGWPDPYASGAIPQPIAPVRPNSTATAPQAASSAAQPSTSSPGLIKSAVNSIASLASLEQWASNLVTRNTSPNTGITLEDIVFVIVGLILIGAGVFSFKGTQTVINTVTKTAAKAAEVAG